MNRYGFCRNNPISCVDSDGLPDDTPAYIGPVNRGSEEPWFANRPGPIEAVGAVVVVGAAAEIGITTAFPRGPMDSGPRPIQSRGGFGRGTDYRRGRNRPCPPTKQSTLQTSGHTIEESRAKGLNRTFGAKLSRGEWRGRLEDLKSANSLAPDFHETRIMSNDDVFNRDRRFYGQPWKLLSQ